MFKINEKAKKPIQQRRFVLRGASYTGGTAYYCISFTDHSQVELDVALVHCSRVDG